MSEAKRAQLIAEGRLNPDGTRLPYVAPVTDPAADVVAEAEAVAAQAVDPSQEV